MIVILFIAAAAIAFLAVGAGIIALIVILIRGTVKKTKFGVNLERTACPSCGEPMPAFRKPANSRQALWGGWTCAKCGAELDKWGRPLGKKEGSA
jgi:hypothetical protein